MATSTAPRPPTKLYDLDVTVVSAKTPEERQLRGDLKPYDPVVEPERRQATKPDDSGSTRPVWNERFVLPLTLHPRDSTLTLEIFHSKPSETPKPLVGALRFELGDLGWLRGVGGPTQDVCAAAPLRPSPGQDPPEARLDRTPCGELPYYPSFGLLLLICPSSSYAVQRIHSFSIYFSAAAIVIFVSTSTSASATLLLSNYGGPGPSAPVDYTPYDYQKRSIGKSGMGMGTGLAVGAVAGAMGGLALEDGIKYEEEKIADRVENDLASTARDDRYSEYRSDY
ncbi:UNVERIFIED_CONTAM: hypothetical protein Scaly_2484000 [Sesamum calycinum]|uniref:C2 domain-containing protein n=1 Tax=Sesamum calycinum TaxID=2727403 RepID=A0AAW2LUH7_9LAMI